MPANEPRPLRFPRRVVVLAAAAFFLTLGWRFLTFTGFTNDHYAHLGLAQQLLLGDRPVRDFVDPGWPLTYLLSASSWRLFGSAMAVEWALTALALGAAAACTLVSAYWLSGSALIASAVTVAEIVIFPRTYSYPKLLPYAAAAVVLAAVAARPTRGRIAVAGAIAALAFLLRHDHGLYLALGAVVCVALASHRDGLRPFLVRFGTLAGSTTAVVLPWALYVSLNGGLPAYFDTAVEFARGEANASNLREWPSFEALPDEPILGVARRSRPLIQVEWKSGASDSERQRAEEKYSLEIVREGEESVFYYPHDTTQANFEALDDDPLVEGTSGLARAQRPVWREWIAAVSPLRLAPALHTLTNADAWLYWLFWSIPVVGACVLATRMVRGREAWAGEAALVAALIVVAVCVNAGFLRDVLRTRFSDAIVPPTLLGAWLLGLCWVGVWASRRLQQGVRFISLLVALVTAAAITAVADTAERIERTGITESIDAASARAAAVTRLLALPHRQSVTPPSYVSAALLPFFDYVDRCVGPEERLLVTGEFPDVVVLAGRRFASDGVVMGAWYSSAVHQQRTVEGFDTRAPLVVVYVDVGPFRQRFPDVEQYIAAHYKPLAMIPAEGGPIPLLVDARRKAARVDQATGWSCFL